MDTIAASRKAAETQANQRLNDSLYDTSNDTIAAGEVLVDMDHDRTQILGDSQSVPGRSGANHPDANHPDSSRSDLDNDQTQVIPERNSSAIDSTQAIVDQEDTDFPNG